MTGVLIDTNILLIKSPFGLYGEKLMEDINAYMTVRELAERIGIQPRTLLKYRRAKPEKLPPAYNFFGQPRFKRSEVEEWEQSCKEVF